MFKWLKTALFEEVEPTTGNERTETSFLGGEDVAEDVETPAASESVLSDLEKVINLACSFQDVEVKITQHLTREWESGSEQYVNLVNRFGEHPAIELRVRALYAKYYRKIAEDMESLAESLHDESLRSYGYSFAVALRSEANKISSLSSHPARIMNARLYSDERFLSSDIQSALEKYIQQANTIELQREQVQ